MNTNPNAKVVLCYGDSNTWGANPQTGKRYAADKRWTGILQKTLGDSFYIIEEGLNGRITVYTDPAEPIVNGEKYLEACINSHKPIDLVIILLGTNDVQTIYHVSGDKLGEGIERLIQVILKEQVGIGNTPPKILVIAPPFIKDKAREESVYAEGPEKSKYFARLFKIIADKYECFFLDASKFIESSDIDGYHLDENAHKKLGEVIAEKAKQMLV